MDADFDEEDEVDVEGYDDEGKTSPNYIRDGSGEPPPQAQSEQDSQDVSAFESILLQDLEHSDSESDEEDDFPFGDGDEEEEEDIDEVESLGFFPRLADNDESMDTGNLSGDEI